MSRRTYYEVATGDLYIEATLKVKISTRVNANYDPEEIVYDAVACGDFQELDVYSIDSEHLSNIEIEIDEWE